MSLTDPLVVFSRCRTCSSSSTSPTEGSRSSLLLLPVSSTRPLPRLLFLALPSSDLPFHLSSSLSRLFSRHYSPRSHPRLDPLPSPRPRQRNRSPPQPPSKHHRCRTSDPHAGGPRCREERNPPRDVWKWNGCAGFSCGEVSLEKKNKNERNPRRRRSN